ncbi:MAG: fibronectin type III domain-containing protein [bacterium]
MPGAITAEILLVGGGGRGNEGGGGGGGVIDVFGKIINAGSYFVTIGSGGTTGSNGGNSSFDTMLVRGGGSGGQGGASGGGAPRDANGPGGAALYGPAEGYPGGRSNAPGWSSAGGGGGAGGPGADGGNEGGWDESAQEWLYPDQKGGDGGIGRVSNITGSSVYYGGGGGGTNGSGEGALPTGGLGGGGAGSRQYAVGGNGVNGLGGGGGAHASGGSGVVVVRYYSPIPIPQTITFGALANRTYGDAPFTVATTASSGLPVTFAISGPAVMTGNMIALGSPGSVTVVASQLGGSGYAAAPNVSQSFTIGKATQTVTFGALSGRTFGEAPFALSASASSGLPVTFTVTSGPAVVLGKTLTLTGTGTVAITATQNGNENYLAASQSQSFTVAADTSAPSAPTGLATSEVTASSVRLTWSASSDNIGVANYEVTGAGIATRTVAGTGTRIFGLQPQTSYTFTVKARDVAGNLSSAASVTVTTLQATTTNSDGDSIPDAVEDLLGTDKNATGHADSSDQLGLKTHKPQQ